MINPDYSKDNKITDQPIVPQSTKDIINAARYKSDKWPHLSRLVGLISYLCGRSFKLIDEHYQTVYVRKSHLVKSIFSDPSIQKAPQVIKAFENMAKLMTYDRTIWHTFLESLVTYTTTIGAESSADKIESSLEQHYKDSLDALRSKVENYKFDRKAPFTGAQELLRGIMHHPAVLMSVDLDALQGTLDQVAEHYAGNDAIQHDLKIVTHLIAVTLAKVTKECSTLLKKLERDIDSVEGGSKNKAAVLSTLQTIARYKNFIPMLDFDKLYVQLKRASALGLEVEELQRSPVISALAEKDFLELQPMLLARLRDDIDSIAKKSPREDQLSSSETAEFRSKSERILKGLETIAKYKNFMDLLDLSELQIQLTRVPALMISHLNEMITCAQSIDLILEEIYMSEGVTKLIEKNHQMQKDYLDCLLMVPGTKYKQFEGFLKQEHRILALISRQNEEVRERSPEKSRKLNVLADEVNARCKRVVEEVSKNRKSLRKLQASLRIMDGHIGIFSDQSEYRVVGDVLSRILKARNQKRTRSN